MEKKNCQIEPPSEHILYLQKETLDCLSKGEIEAVMADQVLPIDSIISFGLDQGILQEGLCSFPDPRKKHSVPIEVLLLPQVMQRLNDEHSLLSAPFMLNSAELMAKLGYNFRTLQEGFNEQNTSPRTAPFHGETLKHILMDTKPDSILNWFNGTWCGILRQRAPGRTRQHILDGMKIEVPEHSWKQYEGAGCVKNPDGTYSYGYKVVWLQEIIDRKGVLVAMKIGPIEDHDIKLGKELVAEFSFEENSSLIMDRGFIDGEWITELKTKRGVDVFIPLRKNMDVTLAAVAMADNQKLWQPHPTRDSQVFVEYENENGELFWPECPVLKSGALVRWVKRNGETEAVLFVTTKEKQSGKQILATYDQRMEIEESHRQLKCFQGIEKLPSKKLSQVVFRIVVATIGYNLMNLFLNSENCDTFE